MLATVRNISPCIEQTASQVSCLLMVASRAKISRPVAATSDFFAAIMSARKLSRSEQVGSISADLRAVGSFQVMAGSFGLRDLKKSLIFRRFVAGGAGARGSSPVSSI